jgi:hypothetical protein
MSAIPLKALTRFNSGLSYTAAYVIPHHHLLHCRLSLFSIKLIIAGFAWQRLHIRAWVLLDVARVFQGPSKRKYQGDRTSMLTIRHTRTSSQRCLARLCHTFQRPEPALSSSVLVATWPILHQHPISYSI